MRLAVTATMNKRTGSDRKHGLAEHEETVACQAQYALEPQRSSSRFTLMLRKATSDWCVTTPKGTRALSPGPNLWRARRRSTTFLSSIHASTRDLPTRTRSWYHLLSSNLTRWDVLFAASLYPRPSNGSTPSHVPSHPPTAHVQVESATGNVIRQSCGPATRLASTLTS